MVAIPEERIAVTAYPEKSVLEWVDQEAVRAGRSRTKQIEHILKEFKSMTEWNRKAAMDPEKNKG